VYTSTSIFRLICNELVITLFQFSIWFASCFHHSRSLLYMMKAFVWWSIIMAGFQLKNKQKKILFAILSLFLYFTSCCNFNLIAFDLWLLTLISFLHLFSRIDSSRNNLEPLSQQQQPANKGSSLTSSNTKSSVTSAELYGDGFSSSSAGAGASGALSARFLTPNGTLITAQRGTPASLPCEVVSLGDGVVS
jgi:hypothetical protein